MLLYTQQAPRDSPLRAATQRSASSCDAKRTVATPSATATSSASPKRPRSSRTAASFAEDDGAKSKTIARPSYSAGRFGISFIWMTAVPQMLA
eukprot:5897678-Prymnesium_polylepis.1